MAVPDDDDTMEFGSRHLPKRYYDAVNAKRRQRFRKNALIVCAAAVIIIIAAWFLLGWATGGAQPGPAAVASPAVPTPQPSPTPLMMPTVTPQSTHSPAISPARAQEIADRYVHEQNGEPSLNLSSSWYEAANGLSDNRGGRYVFVYERVFGGYLTEIDGFEISVDADKGNIISYSREWTTPDYAFSTYSLPSVTRLEATFAVMEEAQKRFPAEVDTLRIHTADIRWKNDLAKGSVPRPGSIPLAWKVIFDDEVIRSGTAQGPAVAWVDVQSGELLAFDYRNKEKTG